MTFLLDEVDTAGAATVFEIRVPAGAFVPPPHSHDGFDESVYVLEGEFTFVIDGVAHELGAGEAGFVGRGQVHSFDNTGSTDGVFLSVATPGIFGPQYFHEIADVLAAAPDAPPDLGALFGVMARHGLTPAVPGAPGVAG
ncbi:MAG: cupin domain-containing protein [Acidimicrobiales bacterium]